MSLVQELTPMTLEVQNRIQEADGEIWDGFWESTRHTEKRRKITKGPSLKESALKPLNEMEIGEWYGISSLCFFFNKSTVARHMEHLVMQGRVQHQKVRRADGLRVSQYKRLS